MVMDTRARLRARFSTNTSDNTIPRSKLLTWVLGLGAATGLAVLTMRMTQTLDENGTCM